MMIHHNCCRSKHHFQVAKEKGRILILVKPEETNTNNFQRGIGGWLSTLPTVREIYACGIRNPRNFFL